ncbi:DMT family transporter [Azospirillum sp. SYSU D00513]|uniref:DMT family transporter n=1 Tax=Azospirillum sp. SYSU D00513 TaxID=2812561 RepID=UPI001A966B0E|nr:DMT family transporter [Azospirillum sp. SYSU D00513]
MGELTGVLAAVLSSALGGTAVVATRYVVKATDPLTLAALRFGLGFLLLLPLALWSRERWPGRGDWAGVAGLGLLFFALFPVLFNASLAFTTAARGALALSTLPLLTMTVAAVLGAEPLTARKSAGVVIATAGVAFALASGEPDGLAAAPAGAWRGDMLMVGAALCMALYNIGSRPFITRSGPLRFTALAMVSGTAALVGIAAFRGSFSALAAFDGAQWSATLYLGAVGGALIFFLWAFALKRTTPTRVAVSVTVNPVTASLLGSAILGEPVSLQLFAGLLAVVLGIWIAVTKAPDRP